MQTTGYWLLTTHHLLLIKILATRYSLLHYSLHAQVLRYFDRCLEQQLPAVHLHLRRHEIASDVFLVRWLLTMFSQSLPLSTCARIWDVVLSEGESVVSSK